MKRKFITRDKAREQGLKTYFINVPCNEGHIDERRVDNNRCCECQREASKRWNDANKKRVKANVARWQKDNADYVAEQRKQLYYANHEENKRKGALASRKQYHQNPEESRRKATELYYANHEENKRKARELYYANHEENKRQMRERYHRRKEE